MESITYSYIEERYCTKCKRNVVIECSYNPDGTHTEECINKLCNKGINDDNCKLR